MNFVDKALGELAEAETEPSIPLAGSHTHVTGARQAAIRLLVRGFLKCREINPVEFREYAQGIMGELRNYIHPYLDEGTPRARALLQEVQRVSDTILAD